MPLETDLRALPGHLLSDDHDYVFVVTYGRTGSTLVQVLLNTLPRTLVRSENGMFHVYAVSQADEALSLLVGEEAGVLDDKGQFTEGSVNARVVERLREIAEMISEEEIEKAEKERLEEVIAQAKPA